MEKYARKVLIVDDESLVRWALSNHLETLGYVTRQAEDGIRALAIISAEGPFEIIITDLVMPEMDGITFIRRVKARYPKTSIVVVSGTPEVSLLHMAEQAGAVQTFQKPFSLQDITGALEQLG